MDGRTDARTEASKTASSSYFEGAGGLKNTAMEAPAIVEKLQNG